MTRTENSCLDFLAVFCLREYAIGPGLCHGRLTNGIPLSIISGKFPERNKQILMFNQNNSYPLDIRNLERRES